MQRCPLHLSCVDETGRKLMEEQEWGGAGPGGQEGKGQSGRNLFVHRSLSPSEWHRAGTLKGFSCGDYLR